MNKEEEKKPIELIELLKTEVKLKIYQLGIIGIIAVILGVMLK